MAIFNKILTSNRIYGAIANMIISQQIESKNIAHNFDLTTLFVDDAGLYGDTKLYYDTDATHSYPFVQDSEEMLNVLKTHRPTDPYCQAVTINTYRQIATTVDALLTKQGFFEEGTFALVNDQFVSWLEETKKIHMVSLVNTAIGTLESEAAINRVEAEINAATTGLTGESKARIEAQTIAQTMVNTIDELKDYSRDYNKIGFLKAYSESDLLVIWNLPWKNKITKMDLPTMFHKDGLINFGEYSLPARYFGDTVTASNVANYTNELEASGSNYLVKAGVTTVRAKREFYTGSVGNIKHWFAGDIVPAGTVIYTDERTEEDDSKLYLDEIYVVNPDVICKITTKSAVKMLTAFSIGSEFNNTKNHSSNKYLTFGYSPVTLLDGKPFITVEAD